DGYFAERDSGRGGAAEDFDLLEDLIFVRTIRGTAGHIRDLLHDVVAGHDVAEHRVPSVEVRRLALRDEELRAVGAGARVRHGENAGLVVPKLLVELVGETV